MEKTNFDDLIERYVTGQLSEQEQIKMDVWLDIMKSTDSTDLDLSAEDEEKLYHKITSSESNVDDIRAFRPWRRPISVVGWVGRIAAGLLLVSVVSYTVLRFTSGRDSTLEVFADNVEKIKLNDGSLVWIHRDSKLSYYETPEGRYAALDGQALFEVAKDADRPFTIHYKDVAIRVVGTSFSVKTGDSVEVKVLTGRVQVSSDADPSGVEVDPSEGLIYTRQGMVEKRMLNQADMTAMTASTTYNMTFNSATLGQVAERLGEKFDVSIELENKDADRCHITINLTGRSLEESLQMLTEVLNIGYERAGDVITITGTGC